MLEGKEQQVLFYYKQAYINLSSGMIWFVSAIVWCYYEGYYEAKTKASAFSEAEAARYCH